MNFNPLAFISFLFSLFSVAFIALFDFILLALIIVLAFQSQVFAAEGEEPGYVYVYSPQRWNMHGAQYSTYLQAFQADLGGANPSNFKLEECEYLIQGEFKVRCRVFELNSSGSTWMDRLFTEIYGTCESGWQYGTNPVNSNNFCRKKTEETPQCDLPKKLEGTSCKCPTSGGSFGSTGCDRGCSVVLNFDMGSSHSFEYSGGTCTVGQDNGGSDVPTGSDGKPVTTYTPAAGKSCAAGYGEMKLGTQRKCVKDGTAPTQSACPSGQMMYMGSCKTYEQIMGDGGSTGGDTGGGTGGDTGGGTGGTGGDTGGGTGGNGGGTGGDTGGGTGEGEGEGEECPQGQTCEGGGGPVSGGKLPDHGKLYTPKYPGGIAGVWQSSGPNIGSTAFGQGLSNMFPSFGPGQCPSWSFDLNFGKGMNLGSFPLAPPCWVFHACGLIILATAAFTARKIIF